MATESFQADFSMGKKASYSLVRAVRNSKKVNHKIEKPYRDVKNKQDIDHLMSKFNRK